MEPDGNRRVPQRTGFCIDFIYYRNNIKIAAVRKLFLAGGMTSVVFNELLSVNETNITKNRENKMIS